MLLVGPMQCIRSVLQATIQHAARLSQDPGATLSTARESSGSSPPERLHVSIHEQDESDATRFLVREHTISLTKSVWPTEWIFRLV